MRFFGSHHFTSTGRKYATTVYKGISATNKQYEDGLKGIVYPTPTNGQAANNSQDSLQRLDAASSHNWGNTTEYGWSSWTRSPSVARLYATFGGKGGIVLTAQVGPEFGTRCMWSPDEFFEQEVLVEGTVRNASVTPIAPETPSRSQNRE